MIDASCNTPSTFTAEFSVNQGSIVNFGDQGNTNDNSRRHVGGGSEPMTLFHDSILPVLTFTDPLPNISGAKTTQRVSG